MLQLHQDSRSGTGLVVGGQDRGESRSRSTRVRTVRTTRQTNRFCCDDCWHQDRDAVGSRRMESTMKNDEKELLGNTGVRWSATSIKKAEDLVRRQGAPRP